MAEIFDYFSKFLRRQIFDPDGHHLGYIYDFLAESGQIPKVKKVIIKKGFLKKKYCSVDWKEIDYSKTYYELKNDKEGKEYHNSYGNNNLISLRKTLLDHQIVDMSGRKVVRVNDIHLLNTQNELFVAHMDIGIKGLIRRLGWDKIIEWLLKIFSPRSGYFAKSDLISWRFVQPLTPLEEKGVIGLNINSKEIANIPVGDLSEIFEELDIYERKNLFKLLPIDVQARLMGEAEFEVQRSLVEVLQPEQMVEIINQMPSDNAADLLSHLPRYDVLKILPLLESDNAKKLFMLLAHKSDSAGGLMTLEYFEIKDDWMTVEAIECIKETEIKEETPNYAYVTDKDGKLVGKVTFRQLLSAKTVEKIKNIMTKNIISVHTDDTAQQVAYVLDKYNLLAIPVVDDNKTMVGIITIDDILSYVLESKEM